MKKLILITALIVLAGTIYGQNLKIGNFVGFHVITITLSPNITMDQYLDFFKNKVLPEEERLFECKSYVAKGIRGECNNCLSYIVVWESEAGRDKFFLPEGGFNEVGEATYAKMKPVLDELAKLGELTSKYTDWVIQ